MIAKSIVSAAVLLTATVAESAAPPPEAVDTQSAQAGATDDDAKNERKICRTERVTGSLTRRSRICLTQAQWREVHDRTRKGVDEMNGSASGSEVCLYEDPNRPRPCY